ncbi:unnamed protein product [Acanthoscelides obtectus]|uniref:Uncharacterized protein n=1 Tax=Acanthoscelides obtectus TaxID=200917 RepID=A0A9P0KM46_ACAOB|nr:unnamed protein product [Acanthoscelides obtectus]CAK1647389.1 hypothetical protein AOBTE_LOCUS15208 [Acanthoscelides obtectus]
MVKDKRNKKVPIDIAFPNNNTLEETYRDKINKYIDMCFEVKDMWKYERARAIPIISITGLVPKSLFKSLKELNLNPQNFQHMQEFVTAIPVHVKAELLHLNRKRYICG